MNNEVYLDYDGFGPTLDVYVTPGCGWTVEWGDLVEHYTGTGDWQHISHGGSPCRCVHIFAEDCGEIIGIDVIAADQMYHSYHFEMYRL